MNCHRISELGASLRQSGQGQRQKAGTHLTLPRLPGTFTGPSSTSTGLLFHLIALPRSQTLTPPHRSCPTRWPSLKFARENTGTTGLGRAPVPLPPSAWAGTQPCCSCGGSAPPCPRSHHLPHGSWLPGHSSLPSQTLGAETPSWEWMALRSAPSLQQLTPLPSSHQQLSLHPWRTHIQGIESGITQTKKNY